MSRREVLKKIIIYKKYIKITFDGSHLLIVERATLPMEFGRLAPSTITASNDQLPIVLLVDGEAAVGGGGGELFG